MRLTRLVVTDDLGQWWIKDPLDAYWHPKFVRQDKNPDAEYGYDPAVFHQPWLARHVDHKYLGGLECPYCVGFWIGAAVLASYHILPRGLWRFAARALTLNEAAAHLGIKIGDFG
jgi:hypothetical protein